VTDLSTLVEPLQRELAVPGDFDTVFPNTTEDGLTGTLADGFAEAQLDGWFPNVTLDLSGATPVVTPDLSVPGSTLVVFYASTRVIYAQLRNLTSLQRYKAGVVEYETNQPATVLKEELDRITQRKKDLWRNAGRQQGATTFVFDSYFARSATWWPGVASAYFSWFPYEIWC